MNYEMQRRDKWNLSQHLPSVLAGSERLPAAGEGLRGTHVHPHTAQDGREASYSPADKETRITNPGTSEGW